MQKVTLIGAANIDIQGFPFDKLIYRDSNPGRVRQCPGGVSRNIAENLSRMGVETELVSAVGKGVNGRFILDSCRESGIGCSNVLIVPDMESSSYMAIMDNDGDMALALSDMSISERITVEYLESIRDVIESSAVIEVDPCLSGDVVAYVLEEYSGIPVFIDPVSIGKAKKIKNLLGKIDTLKLNRLEAEYLSGSKIATDKDLLKVSSYFLNTGVHNLFITLGKNGVYYTNGEQNGTVVPPVTEIQNATGAGDAFMAGVIYGSLTGYGLERTAALATAVSIAALSSRDTVNSDITIEMIERIIKERF